MIWEFPIDGISTETTNLTDDKPMNGTTTTANKTSEEDKVNEFINSVSNLFKTGTGFKRGSA